MRRRLMVMFSVSAALPGKLDPGKLAWKNRLTHELGREGQEPA
jgi:hypothetical protein